jgi:4-hydroxybenzoate polyprenyltransferase
MVMVVATWHSTTVYTNLSWLIWLATAFFVAMLAYQHTLVKPYDLRRVNIAFFTTNGIASLVFGTLVFLDLYVV